MAKKIKVVPNAVVFHCPAFGSYMVCGSLPRVGDFVTLKMPSGEPYQGVIEAVLFKALKADQGTLIPHVFVRDPNAAEKKLCNKLNLLIP